MPFIHKISFLFLSDHQNSLIQPSLLTLSRLFGKRILYICYKNLLKNKKFEPVYDKRRINLIQFNVFAVQNNLSLSLVVQVKKDVKITYMIFNSKQNNDQEMAKVYTINKIELRFVDKPKFEIEFYLTQLLLSIQCQGLSQNLLVQCGDYFSLEVEVVAVEACFLLTWRLSASSDPYSFLQCPYPHLKSLSSYSSFLRLTRFFFRFIFIDQLFISMYLHLLELLLQSRILMREQLALFPQLLEGLVEFGISDGLDRDVVEKTTYRVWVDKIEPKGVPTIVRMHQIIIISESTELRHLNFRISASQPNILNFIHFRVFEFRTQHSSYSLFSSGNPHFLDVFHQNNSFFIAIFCRNYLFSFPGQVKQNASFNVIEDKC